MSAGSKTSVVSGTAVLLIVMLAVAATVYHQRASREARRNQLSGDAFVAWLQDMSDDKNAMWRFVPLAKASIDAERKALAGDRVTFAGHLMKYSLMLSFSNFSFSGSGPAGAAELKVFEAALAKELGDNILQMVSDNDPRALVYADLIANGDTGDSLPRDVRERILFGSIRLARARGQTPPAHFLTEAASRLNGWCWGVVVKPGQPADAYAHALMLAEAAVNATPDEANYVNTLAYAQYRAGKYPEAAATIARAVTLHKQPDNLDTVMVGMTAAKTGRLDDARKALESVEQREAERTKEAISKKQRPRVDERLQALLGEAKALLPPIR